MNSLEFINEEIKRYKALVSIFSGAKKSYYKKVVNQLKQIKTELESWEIVKEELQIVFKGKNHYGEPLRRYELNVIGQNKIDTLNKALEVNE